MKRFITADVIMDGKGNAHEGMVLHIDQKGTILEIIPNGASLDFDSVTKYDGCLMPGFINTHCHLELSHMKGLVDTGTTLLPFLQNVVKYRDFPDEVIQAAIEQEDDFMYQNGIVAVGDISNKADTAAIKAKSKIKYYTFVEMFDFMQSSLTEQTIAQYKTVYEAHLSDHKNKKSYVPHAPYTVSSQLFEAINNFNIESGTISIHNQETEEENKLFESFSGAFIPFFSDFGFDVQLPIAKGKRSIHYTLGQLKPKHKTIMVHNTTCKAEDIIAAHQWSNEVYWATCPNANLYIENKLPNYQTFIDQDAKMTIGTDSLTSNWQLNIASEMLTIQKYASYIPLPTLVKWACKNGAEALGYDESLGTFEVGKKPGINQLQVIKVKDKWSLSSDHVCKIY